jgi:hypothetical protein
MDREKRETAFAEQYLKFLDSNLKPKVAFEIMQKMGYTGTRSTMNRHIASLRRTGHALSLVKKDSSHSSLNDHQMSIVNSWISDQNTNNRPIGYSDVQKFIYDTFSIEVCTKTAGNILHRLGHTQNTCQSKTSGFKKPNAELKNKKEERMKDPATLLENNIVEDNSTDEDSMDDNYEHPAFKVSPGTIRRKITMFLASKEMTQTAFLKECGGVNSNSLGRFMKLKGNDNGRQNSTFAGAVRFFYRHAQKAKDDKKKEKEQEKALAKEGKKKPKAESKAEAVVTNKKRKFSSDDEEEEDEHDEEEEYEDGPKKKIQKTLPVAPVTSSSSAPVPHTVSTVSAKGKKAAVEELISTIEKTPLSDNRVMDDCDTVRTHIAQFLQKENVSMKRFSEAIGITPPPINKFLSKKGWSEGAGSEVYPAAYCFLERYRLYKQEPISEKRKKDLVNHSNGFPLKEPPKRIWVMQGMPTEKFNAMVKQMHARDPQ